MAKQVIKFELLNVDDLTFATLIKSTLTWLAIEALPPLPTIYMVLFMNRTDENYRPTFDEYFENK